MKTAHLQAKDLVDYSEGLTSEEPPLLQQLIRDTYERMDMPQMLTGRMEGRTLKMLVQICGAVNAIELGMFTGYSALSIAEGLPNHGRLLTCDVDPNAQQFAQSYFDRSPHGHKITIKMGPALDTINELDQTIDFAFIDADKESYPLYFNALIEKMRPGGLLVFDNAFLGGKALKPNDEESQAIAETNKLILADPRCENVLLTIRDGFNLVRKL